LELISITNLKILQINLNRSAPATESALNLATELNIDIIAIQEPWVYPNPNNDYTVTRLVIHSGFTQILPYHGILRPRTLFYVSKAINIANIAIESPQDPDCLIIDINYKNSKIQVINIYNEKHLDGSGIYTVNKGLLPNPLYKDSIVLGNFNTYYL